MVSDSAPFQVLMLALKPTFAHHQLSRIFLSYDLNVQSLTIVVVLQALTAVVVLQASQAGTFSASRVDAAHQDLGCIVHQ